MENHKLLIVLQDFEEIASAISTIDLHLGHTYHVLCFKRYQALEVAFCEKIQFHFIDDKKIEFFLKSPLINDAFAIEELSKSLATLKELQISEIVDFSRDHISSKICSYLQQEKTEVHHDSLWSTLYDLCREIDAHPINLKDLYGPLSSFGRKTTPQRELFRFSKSHDRIVRKKLQKTHENDQTVGIFPFCEDESKSLSVQEVCQLFEFYKMRSPNDIPILLYCPSPSQRKRAMEVSEYFSGKVLSLESGFQTLNSVLEKLDFLICVDTMTICLANLMGTRSLLVSQGRRPHPYFFQSSTFQGDLVLMAKKTTDRVSPEGVYKAYGVLCNPSSFKEVLFLREKLYYVETDALGAIYLPMSERPCFQSDGKRFLFREVLAQSAGLSKVSYFNFLHPLIDTQALDYFKAEKIRISELTKNSLNCLRGMNAKNASHNRSLLEGLDKIFSYQKDSQYLSIIPLGLFSSQMQKIQGQHINENKQIFEKGLFTLKNNLQRIFLFISSLEMKNHGHKVHTSRPLL